MDAQPDQTDFRISKEFRHIEAAENFAVLRFRVEFRELTKVTGSQFLEEAHQRAAIAAEALLRGQRSQIARRNLTGKYRKASRSSARHNIFSLLSDRRPDSIRKRSGSERTKRLDIVMTRLCAVEKILQQLQRSRC